MVGTEVGDTGRRVGLLVGFLIGGHVGFLTGGHVGFLIGRHVGFSFLPEYGDTAFKLFPCFPDLAFLFCEVNAIEFSPPMTVCVVSTSTWTNVFSSFLFPFSNMFACLGVFVSALFVSFLKRSIDVLTASSVS